MSVIIDAELLPSSQVEALYEECVELRKIVTRSILTVKQTIDAKERQ